MKHARVRLFLWVLAAAALALLGGRQARAASVPVSWTARLEPADARPGEAALVVVTAKIDEPWHIYSLTPPKGSGPRPTHLELVAGGPLIAAGKALQPAPTNERDLGFNIDVEIYPKAVAFGLPVKLAESLTGKQKAAVKVQYQACKEGTCIPPRTEEVTVNFTPGSGAARADHLAPPTAAPKQPSGYQPPKRSEGEAPRAAENSELPAPAPATASADSGVPVASGSSGSSPTPTAAPRAAPDAKSGAVNTAAPPPGAVAGKRAAAPPSGGDRPPLSAAAPLSAPVGNGPAPPTAATSGTRPLSAANGASTGNRPSVAPLPATTAGSPPPSGPVAAPAAAAPADVSQKIADAQAGGFLPFLWLSILSGFLALLTPCVFPMVPITVSFFAKQQEEGRGGLGGPLAYCLGIVGTFTGLGLLVTALFGASGLQRLATDPLLNVALAVLFIVLALNLFGAFEIILPSWLLEKAQSGSGKGGLLGPMVMGLTFTLTSFTCTVAFVGTLLATAARGSWFWPALGMLAFSSAFSLPFFLLALFPQWLAKLPRAGSWLVTVKAYMGFLELAAAVKFLSNADLVHQAGFITRPVFLAVWTTIFLVAACYMLGWLRLPHDAGGKIGLVRGLFGLATAAIGVFCLAGLNGQPLGKLAAFLPPSDYRGRGVAALVSAAGTIGEIPWVRDDYDAALQRARAEGKPLFVNYTGVTCTNCRDIENNVFTRPEVVEALAGFVPVELYTDKETPASQKYQAMQLQKYGQVTLPFYAVEAPDGAKVAQRDYQPPTPASFVEFLSRTRQQAQASGAGSVAMAAVPPVAADPRPVAHATALPSNNPPAPTLENRIAAAKPGPGTAGTANSPASHTPAGSSPGPASRTLGPDAVAAGKPSGAKAVPPGAAPRELAPPAPVVSLPGGAAPERGKRTGPVAWTARLEPSGARTGESGKLILEAKVEAPWHIYSLATRTGPGPKPTRIELVDGSGLQADGEIQSSEPKRELDEGFKIEVEIYENSAVFTVPVKVVGRPGAGKATVRVQYQACKGGSCLPPRTVEVPVGFAVAEGRP